MNIVYFAVGEQYAKQAEAAASILRLTNPTAKAWCITDKETPFDTLMPFRTHSSHATLIYDRTLAQYQFLREHNKALFLDSDCVVNGPLTGVFKGPVSITDRVPPKQAATQIYNGGVLYGEGREALKFWQDWIDMYPQLERGAWGWWGDQMILPILAEHHKPNVFPGNTHNYVPTHLVECYSPIKAHIVHFKGTRKSWLPVYLDTLKEAYAEQRISHAS